MSKKHATKTDDTDMQTASAAPEAPVEAAAETPTEEPYGAEFLRGLHADLSGIQDRCNPAL